MSFEYAIDFILKHEGGFQRDPDDSGNWTGGKVGVGELRGTKYGVAASSYPILDIATLTLEGAKRIYRRDYWNPFFDELDKRVGAKLLDIAVNCGTGTAVKLLQRACGVVDDGVLGPKTKVAAISKDPDELLVKLSAKQKAYYAAVVLKDPRKGKYLAGWNKRSEWKGVA